MQFYRTVGRDKFFVFIRRHLWEKITLWTDAVQGCLFLRQELAHKSVLLMNRGILVVKLLSSISSECRYIRVIPASFFKFNGVFARISLLLMGLWTYPLFMFFSSSSSFGCNVSLSGV